MEEIKDDGTEPRKTFYHIPSEIGALEAEEVGVEHLLRDIKDTTVRPPLVCCLWLDFALLSFVVVVGCWVVVGCCCVLLLCCCCVVVMCCCYVLLLLLSSSSLILSSSLLSWDCPMIAPPLPPKCPPAANGPIWQVSTLTHEISAKLSSLKSLHTKLREIETYVDNVLDPAVPLPPNNDIIGQLQDIFNLLPNVRRVPALVCWGKRALPLRLSALHLSAMRLHLACTWLCTCT